MLFTQQASITTDVAAKVKAEAETQAQRAVRVYNRLNNPSAAQLRVALQPVYSSNSTGGTLSSTCSFSGSLAAGDLTLNSRLSRPGAPTGTCAAAYTTPATIAGGPFYYDTYTFTNTTGAAQCVTATLTTTDLTNANIQYALYNGAFRAGQYCYKLSC